MTAPRDHDRAAILAAITRTIKPRFSLSAEAFADLLLERIQARGVEPDPIAYAKRLCLDDLYLAMACTRGDEDAWREFSQRFFDYVRTFTQRFVHDRAAADVADTIIADLWTRGRLAQYDGRSTLRTWLGAVAAHAAINAGKVEQRMVPLEPDLVKRGAPAGPPPLSHDPTEDQQTHQLFASLVKRALADLDADGKLLLQLYYEQQLTLDQIERMIGVSKPTLSRRLDRLRRIIRESIEAQARSDLRMSADALRDRLDFSRLDFDLAAVLGGAPVKGDGRGVV